jgi:hypothetical protein
VSMSLRAHIVLLLADGSNLQYYHEAWSRAETSQPFQYWLDFGEGKVRSAARVHLKGSGMHLTGPVAAEMLAREARKPADTVCPFTARRRLMDKQLPLGRRTAPLRSPHPRWSLPMGTPAPSQPVGATSARRHDHWQVEGFGRRGHLSSASGRTARGSRRQEAQGGLHLRRGRRLCVLSRREAR